MDSEAALKEIMIAYAHENGKGRLAIYRARKNGLQNVINTTQAGLGRLV